MVSYFARASSGIILPMERESHASHDRPVAATPEKLLAAALRLKPRQRAAMADRLVESLPPDPQVEAAWEVEIKKRIDEIESGAVKAIPWSIARRQIFAARRKKK